MWEKAMRNSLETNEKTENSSKKQKLFKKKLKIIELKDRKTEINTYQIGLIIEHR